MPRLMKGMFHRKGSSSFYVRFHENGRDRWKSLGADYEEACRRLRKLRDDGETPVVRITVKQAADQFYESYVKTRRRPEDHQMSRQRLDKYLLEFMGRMFLAKVTKEHVRSYRLWLERGGRLKPATVKHILSDLRCLMYWAVDSDLVDRMAFPRRVMPKLQERPPDRLTDEEAEAVKKLPNPYGFIARFGIGTGMRWGELIRAQSTDIQNGSLVVSQTKSGKIRRIPLAPELLAELRLHVGRLMPLINPWGFAKMVRRSTGIERFHAHQMRHTYACQMQEAGVSLGALQQLLGHSTVVMTQRYARLGDDAVRLEVERAVSRGRL
jgi:integrase